ncbi:MAG: DUF4230 domain-containing protein [Leptolyngbya sp. SIO4C1]|nr:DUF4230 domain-containing protein [Leptolyngbya sp. SIO4C1]
MRLQEPKSKQPKPPEPKPPKAPEPAAPSRRSSPFGLMRSVALSLVGGTAIVGLLAGYAFWRSGPRFLEGMKLMLAPPPPEESVDLRTVVVQQVQEASELTTAVFTMEAVVPAVSDRTFAGYTIGQTNLLYIAYGEVRAGIDLSDLTTEDVAIERTDSDSVITLILPSPRLLDSKIDVTRSRVYDYSRGFLNLGPDRAPQLQTLAQTSALTQIEQAACEQGILDQANSQARLVLGQLIGSLDYGRVRVETQLPDSCGRLAESAS